MKRFLLFGIFIFYSTLLLHAQDSTNASGNYQKKYYCILVATKNYKEAKKEVEKAASKIGLKKDYKGLSYHKTNGLTMSQKEREDNGFEYPSYIARGRYDDGEYLSIEHSSAFENFAKGYYIVVARSGTKEETTVTLTKVKKIYKTAYIKLSNVYMGCMH